MFKIDYTYGGLPKGRIRGSIAENVRKEELLQGDRSVLEMRTRC